MNSIGFWIKTRISYVAFKINRVLILFFLWKCGRPPDRQQTERFYKRAHHNQALTTIAKALNQMTICVIHSSCTDKTKLVVHKRTIWSVCLCICLYSLGICNFPTFLLAGGLESGSAPVGCGPRVDTFVCFSYCCHTYRETSPNFIRPGELH